MTTGPSAPPRKKRPWLAPLLIFAVFAGPLLATWVAVQYEAFRPAGSSANGHLLTPARPVDTASLRSLDSTALSSDLLQGRWLLLYIGSSACDEICQRSLYNMRQARLAVGEDAHRVQRLMVVTDGPPSGVLQEVLAGHQGLTVATADGAALAGFLAQFQITPGDDPARAQRLYLLDPLGNLVLYYGPDANPKGMLEDLERLLKASQIG